MKPSYEHKKFCLVFLISLLIFSLSGCFSSGSGNNTATHGNVIGVPNVISTVDNALCEGIVSAALPATAPQF